MLKCLRRHQTFRDLSKKFTMLHKVATLAIHCRQYYEHVSKDGHFLNEEIVDMLFNKALEFGTSLRYETDFIKQRCSSMLVEPMRILFALKAECHVNRQKQRDVAVSPAETPGPSNNGHGRTRPGGTHGYKTPTQGMTTALPAAGPSSSHSVPKEKTLNPADFLAIELHVEDDVGEVSKGTPVAQGVAGVSAQSAEQPTKCAYSAPSAVNTNCDPVSKRRKTMTSEIGKLGKQDNTASKQDYIYSFLAYIAGRVRAHSKAHQAYLIERMVQPLLEFEMKASRERASTRE